MEEDEFVQDAINRMQSDCTRLDHLMESVLAFSRPVESVLAPVNMAALLQKILTRWHPRLATGQCEGSLPRGRRYARGYWAMPVRSNRFSLT
jgi:signal transduction histidine kinase